MREVSFFSSLAVKNKKQKTEDLLGPGPWHWVQVLAANLKEVGKMLSYQQHFKKLKVSTEALMVLLACALVWVE